MQRTLIEREVLHDSFVEQIESIETELRAPSAAQAFDLGELSVAALQGSRQAVCLTDALVDLPGPRISYVNDAYTDIFCCDSDDVIGETPRVGQGPLTNRHVLDRLRAHLAAGESVQAQAINYRFDKTTFRLRWSIDPIRRDGVVVGFIAFMRDITIEDRMRRRLAALDTLTDRGREASTLVRTERDSSVAGALAAALRPVIAEIGVVNVRIGRASESTQVDAEPVDLATSIREAFPVGPRGLVTIDLHPDAGELFDRLAVSELAEHARWLLELGDPG